MIVEIRIPTPGESVNEVEITNWLVGEGDMVFKNQELAEIESDKATLTLVATEAGKIHLLAPTGKPIKVDSVACTIDNSFTVESSSGEKNGHEVAGEIASSLLKTTEPVEVTDHSKDLKVTPLARQMMEQNQLDIESVLKGLKRISANEVKAVLNHNSSIGEESNLSNGPGEIKRQKMSALRKKLSQRLVAVKNETAMLTTFNEVDMSAVMNLRSKYQQAFIDKYGVKLGFMSFFIKASSIALSHYPVVNSMIDGDDILTPGFVDISVAVQAPKGLMVPVIRNVQHLSLAEVEIRLKDLADKARQSKLSIDEMTGGTFTITNGGVFGSMLSTPLINPPQSAILGMHNIVDRPVAIEGKVEIRPVMYVALSYDHRIIDGKDSVGFLMKVKEILENPVGFITNGDHPDRKVLGL